MNFHKRRYSGNDNSTGGRQKGKQRTKRRFFDDYSRTHLGHDSSGGRKEQRRGKKFRANFKLHYDRHVEDWRKGEMGLASAQQAYIKVKGRDDPMIPPLRDGWKEELDEATGIPFYLHDESGERSWVRPGFIPPPPPGPSRCGGSSFLRRGSHGGQVSSVGGPSHQRMYSQRHLESHYNRVPLSSPGPVGFPTGYGFAQPYHQSGSPPRGCPPPQHQNVRGPGQGFSQPK